MGITLADKFFMTPAHMAAMKQSVKAGDYRKFETVLRFFSDERNHKAIERLSQENPQALADYSQLLFTRLKRNPTVEETERLQKVQSILVRAHPFTRATLKENVLIKCKDGEEVLMNKQLLALRCPHFQVTFGSGMSESRKVDHAGHRAHVVDYTDYSSKTMQRFKEYVENEQFTTQLGPLEIIELASLANLLEWDPLQKDIKPLLDSLVSKSYPEDEFVQIRQSLSLLGEEQATFYGKTLLQAQLKSHGIHITFRKEGLCLPASELCRLEGRSEKPSIQLAFDQFSAILAPTDQSEDWHVLRLFALIEDEIRSKIKTIIMQPNLDLTLFTPEDFKQLQDDCGDALAIKLEGLPEEKAYNENRVFNLEAALIWRRYVEPDTSVKTCLPLADLQSPDDIAWIRFPESLSLIDADWPQGERVRLAFTLKQSTYGCSVADLSNEAEKIMTACTSHNITFEERLPDYFHAKNRWSSSTWNTRYALWQTLKLDYTNSYGRDPYTSYLGWISPLSAAAPVSAAASEPMTHT